VTVIPAKPRRVDSAGIAIAGLLLVCANLILWDVSSLEISQTYGLGPKAMPMVVASGLILLAIGNFVMALRGGLPARESADPRAIFFILGGLAALIALIGLGGGFIPATAILFATTAAAFGRRAFFTDLAIGLNLGLVIYLAFDKLLTLSLPAGPIEKLF
jgi:putative tricarboxylic transport membrane protein